MNCDEVRRLVQDYVTRELSPENRRLLDAHLVECAECQRELALMTAVVSTLDHQPVLEPSANFSARVLGNLPRQREFAPSPWWSLALAPLLGGLAWLARGPVERALETIFGRSGLGHLSVPAVSLQQAGIAAGAVVVLGLLVAAGGAVFCWQTYLRD
ncbi:MAG: zf-HC2 domain-containing protein [candidate division WOR-3 bacterium]|nr:zf-HC2 domain-containing protein [candidate division WOR-3 bacterium]